MRKFSILILATCLACAPTFATFAADEVFSAAAVPTTTPSLTVQTPGATITASPVVVKPSWFDGVVAVIYSPTFLAGIAYLLLRVETYLQAKTKINLTKATGMAHSVFNMLFDMGLIQNGLFRAAEESFFANFDTQFFNAYGHQPDGTAQDTAHAVFAQLFTAHTGDTLPVAVPPAPKA